jgi:hypothetical protein
VLAVLALAAGYVVFDLARPLRVDIRVFDPDEVARLDTAMWRSYYDRKPLPLFLELAELMRLQFHFPPVRSFVVAASAARAAFVFKDGRGRADYQKALPDLIRDYAAIRRISITPFDVRRAAETELEWWIVHRERLRRGEGDLVRSLAEAAGALYGMPASSFAEYGRWRTAAMHTRDTKAVAGGVTEHDWRKIEDDLRRSWGSLRAAVGGLMARP